MSTIYVDGKPFEADPKKNLLHTCLSHGFNLEYFCWHPALGSVGACRQCAVKQFKDEKDTQGRIVMACMTPAAEGTRISIEDSDAAEFRKAVIEGLMLNHPHDCPVCDEGGECHLQDMTVMAGHDYRNYEFRKRTFNNQDLGPLIHHEMNRCIQCYRCVRYYRDYAGGVDLNSFLLHDTVFFGRQEDGVLESEFSGNLAEVCPTGVFTDKTLHHHYTRKWDLQMAPSLCAHCGLGCNTSPGERYGQLRRIVNRYNSEVNGYFLCDRGRFGYEFVNSEKRVRQARLLQNGETMPLPKTQAVESFASLLGDRTIGIGSPRASLEANFALRSLVGPDRFYAGVAAVEWRLIQLMQEILRRGPVRSASLGEVEHCDAVLILGEDVTQTAPRMALGLRQSVRLQPMKLAEKLNIPLFLDQPVRELAQDDKGPLFIASLHATKLDDIAAATYHGSPDDIARLGFAVAHVLDASAPAVADASDELRALAGRIAAALQSAERPLVIAGPSCQSQAVVEAAANVATSLSKVGRETRISFTAPEANSFGVGLLGGASLEAAFEAVEKGEADTVVILENDLYRRAPAAQVDSFFGKLQHAIVLDQLENATTAQAELLLPAATFAESEGTFVNHEGRAQRFFKVFAPPGDEQPSWQWLRDTIDALGCDYSGAWRQLDDVNAALAGVPGFENVRAAAPLGGFRVEGAKVPRAPHRYSGRTAMLANISVHEPKPPQDADSPLSFSMEGASKQPPSALIPFLWSPGWNSIQAANKFQTEIAGPLKGGDPGVRLLDPGDATSAGGGYFMEAPAAFKRRDQEWLFVPRYHIFGSEELSLSAPAIAQLAAQPYVALAAGEAQRLGIQPGDQVEIRLHGFTGRLPVELLAGLPEGFAALPAGLPPLQGIPLPSWGRITRP